MSSLIGMVGLYSTTISEDPYWTTSAEEFAKVAEQAAIEAKGDAASANSAASIATQAAQTATEKAQQAQDNANRIADGLSKVDQAVIDADLSAAQAAASALEAKDQADLITGWADKSKEWAISDTEVEAGKYSSKKYSENSATSAATSSAQATIATTKASEASVSATTATSQASLSTAQAILAKDWATKMGTSVDGTEFSAKYYADKAKTSVAGVQTFNGRNGQVVPQTGDYTYAQVTGAASSGANSDITSLSGLTTPLSISQGGTGGKTPAEGSEKLGAMHCQYGISTYYGSGDLHTGIGFYSEGNSPSPGGNGSPFQYAEIMTIAEGGGGPGSVGNLSQIAFATADKTAPRYRQRIANPWEITNWREFLVKDLNTTVDVNGFVKIASPIVKLKPDGSSEVNDQAQGVTTERLAVGVYKISGVLGFNSDPSWGGNGGGFSIPQNSNGLPLLWVDYKVDEVGDITLKTYHRVHSGVPSFASNEIEGVIDGEPVDIPEGRWVDLRVEMPSE